MNFFTTYTILTLSLAAARIDRRSRKKWSVLEIFKEFLLPGFFIGLTSNFSLQFGVGCTWRSPKMSARSESLLSQHSLSELLKLQVQEGPALKGDLDDLEIPDELFQTDSLEALVPSVEIWPNFLFEFPAPADDVKSPDLLERDSSEMTLGSTLFHSEEIKSKFSDLQLGSPPPADDVSPPDLLERDSSEMTIGSSRHVTENTLLFESPSSKMKELSGSKTGIKNTLRSKIQSKRVSLGQEELAVDFLPKEFEVTFEETRHREEVKRRNREHARASRERFYKRLELLRKENRELMDKHTNLVNEVHWLKTFSHRLQKVRARMSHTSPNRSHTMSEKQETSGLSGVWQSERQAECSSSSSSSEGQHWSALQFCPLDSCQEIPSIPLDPSEEGFGDVSERILNMTLLLSDGCLSSQDA